MKKKEYWIATFWVMEKTFVRNVFFRWRLAWGVLVYSSTSMKAQQKMG